MASSARDIAFFLPLVSEALTISVSVSVASLAGSEQTTVGRTKLLILKWLRDCDFESCSLEC